MSELVPDPTIKEEFLKLRGKHGRAKDKARTKIANSMNEAMIEFQRETGCTITSVSVDISQHYKGRDVDMSVITYVGLKSDIEKEHTNFLI